ncbi:clarin-3 [Hoplias malabaricus]|uniref:clarin-3 n=1 Tax=Hoplias malabaricus TaxID=27720 RepID=UPI003461CFF4
MPSTKKIMYFLSSAILQVAAVGILGYGMSTDWVQSKMACGPLGNEIFNGSATIKMGLFNGSEKKEGCPRFDTNNVVPVFAKLEQIGGAAVALQGLVVGLLSLSLLGSAGSILITLYNTVSNPYETYMGPIGLFACSGMSAISAFLALVLYLINVLVVRIGMEIAELKNDSNLKDEEVQLLVGFYLLLPYIAADILTTVLVYLYSHEAYTQRREQEKPPRMLQKTS